MWDGRRPIRVLTVDDSPTIQRLIALELQRHRDIECIDTAAHPYEAREKIKALSPDVLTLDVEMPHMNGLDFLKKIMTLRPMPVLMFSNMTNSGSRAAIEALSIGAVHCLGKSPTMATDGTLSELPGLIRMAAAARIQARPDPARSAVERGYRNSNRMILIGSSTGGVDALERILSKFPASCPPTLITQHMPAEFLRSFARRMNQLCAPNVRLAKEGEPIMDGNVYIAPGGEYHLAVSAGRDLRCRLDPQDKVTGHRPSVDVLFRSAVPVGKKVVAVILTGMGSDGARGMCELREAGARTLAQDEASCTVFGMPRVALEMGGAETAISLDRISHKILDFCAQPGFQSA